MPESAATPLANGVVVDGNGQMVTGDLAAQSESGSAVHHSVKKNGDN